LYVPPASVMVAYVSASRWPTTPRCPGSGTLTIDLPQKWPRAVGEGSCGCARKVIHRTLLPVTLGALATPAALFVVLKGEHATLWYLLGGRIWHWSGTPRGTQDPLVR
jgi:hypothetical protein